MLYQPLLTDSVPYVARKSGIRTFSANIHHEIEIIYCRKGHAVIGVGEKLFTLGGGDAVIIGSMVPHSGVETSPGNEGLVLEIGPVFLGERFRSFVSIGITGKVYSAEKDSKLCSLLDEILVQCGDKNKISELLLIGNIYKVCGLILKDAAEKGENADSAALAEKQSVEKALELVYHHYSEQITVDKAAALCGYGKSNFCKVFKNVMGISFHSFLNSLRVKNASYLLCESEKGLDEIAAMVGLREAKTLCRVFREFTGMSPGQYRKTYYK